MELLLLPPGRIISAYLLDDRLQKNFYRVDIFEH